MTKIRKITILLLIAAASLIMGAASAEGSVTVKIPCEGSVTIYEVGLVEELPGTEGGFFYKPVDELLKCGVSFANLQGDNLPEHILYYSELYGIKGMTKKLSRGQAVFGQLDEGLYLISFLGDGRVRPFFAEVKRGEQVVISHDETDSLAPVCDSTSISVSCRWSTEGQKTPEEVTALLLRDGIPVAVSELNEDNGWSTLWTFSDRKGNYSVVEQVPEGYLVSYIVEDSEIVMVNSKNTAFHW